MTSDNAKMVAYICRRLPDAKSTRIRMVDGPNGVVADLTPLPDGRGGYDLQIESNCPEWANLTAVYEHFRLADMTSVEWQQWNCFWKCRSEQRDRIRTLSVTERELFDAASPTEPLRGEALAVAAGHEYDGHTKGCLAHLVKLKLLRKHGGYIRADNA